MTTTEHISGHRPAGAATVHTLKVTLQGSQPPIWRRLEIPSAFTLAQVHETLQATFGWWSQHLWAFDTGFVCYGVPDPDLEHRDAGRITVGRAAPRTGRRMTYTYDFGDNWRHDILIEAIIPAEPGVTYPRCTAGRRAAPPEDCGGVRGHDRLLAILADPAHDEHRHRLDWLGLGCADEFDPTAFDLAETNRALALLAHTPAAR